MRDVGERDDHDAARDEMLPGHSQDLDGVGRVLEHIAEDHYFDVALKLGPDIRILDIADDQLVVMRPCLFSGSWVQLDSGQPTTRLIQA